MITHFYSDPHFGHKNIIEYANRPHDTLEDMNEDLMCQYQNHVGGNDTVLFCGDYSFEHYIAASFRLRSLPGRKILVRGNHDGPISRCLKMGFDLVVDKLYLTIANQKVTVVHRPQDADGDTKSGFVIHGHTHSAEQIKGRKIHVGVDAWDFRPARMEEIEALILDALP